MWKGVSRAQRHRERCETRMNLVAALRGEPLALGVAERGPSDEVDAHGFRGAKALVRAARQRLKQRRILEFAGTFDADPTYDYKEQRRVP